MIPNVNEDLTGLSPIDWEAVAKFYPDVAKYKVGNVLPRDDVMRSIVHRTGALQAKPMEEICKRLTDDQGKAAIELRKLAKQYIVFKNKNARLPSFGKWVSSMFSNNQELVAAMAKAGQHGRTASGGITISCNPVDILCGGLGKHFATCLGPKGCDRYYGDMYANVLPAVLNECSGVAIAFIRDGDSQYLSARCWVHHIEVDGKTAIQLNDVYGNGMIQQQVAELIAAKGYDVYNQDYEGTKYKFINNFNRPIHWDALEMPARGKLLAAAHADKKAVA